MCDMTEARMPLLARFFSESGLVNTTGRCLFANNHDGTATVDIAFKNSRKERALYRAVLDTSRKETSVIPTVVDEDALHLKISNLNEEQLDALTYFVLIRANS